MTDIVAPLEVDFSGCEFKRNTAVNEGGGVTLIAAATTVGQFTNCVFSGNQASYGINVL